MRHYGVIPATFWEQLPDRVRGDGEAMAMACYLMTSPHSNIVGIYRLPIEYIHIDTRLAPESIRRVLELFQEVEFAYYDESAKTIYIPSFASIQVGPSLNPKDNRVKAIRMAINQIRHDRFKALFLKRYSDAYHLSTESTGRSESGSPFEGASKGLQSPFDGQLSTEEKKKIDKTVDNQGPSKGLRRGSIPILYSREEGLGGGRKGLPNGDGAGSKDPRASPEIFALLFEGRFSSARHAD